MERHDQQAVATFYVDAPVAAHSTVALSDAAAHHARVKRLEVGDRVRVTDGQGTVASGAIRALGKRDASVDVADVERVAREVALHLRVPIGDRDRMLWLAEKATELGITSWQAIRFRRSASVSPRGEGPAFAEKVRARMIAALEQSGRAWLPTILPDATVAYANIPGHAERIYLDALGTGIGAESIRGSEVVVIFGPEGGVEPDERALLRDSDWRPVRLAAATLRFETAGIAAVSVLRAVSLPEQD